MDKYPEGITRDDTVHGETYYTAADMATASAQGVRDGVASLSAAEPAAQFDAQGFREWVLRNLPKGSVIGNGEWWADHLTQWAQRFVKKEAPALTQVAAIAAGAAVVKESLTTDIAEGAAWVADYFNMHGFYPSLAQAFAAGSASHGQAPAGATAAAWPQLRSALAMAMLGWGGRPDRTQETAHKVLDAITEPGMPLAILRSAPDWRAPASPTIEGESK